MRLRANGKDLQRVRRTQTEALAALAEMKRSSAMPIPAFRYTVGDCLDDILAHGEHSRGWTRATMRSYRSTLDLHLRPALGKSKLAGLGVR